MEAREIRTLTTEEIERHLEENYRELFALRYEKAATRLEDTSRLKVVKRDIARMKTILRERELIGELVEEAGQ